MASVAKGPNAASHTAPCHRRGHLSQENCQPGWITASGDTHMPCNTYTIYSFRAISIDIIDRVIDLGHNSLSHDTVREEQWEIRCNSSQQLSISARDISHERLRWGNGGLLRTALVSRCKNKGSGSDPMTTDKPPTTPLGNDCNAVGVFHRSINDNGRSRPEFRGRGWRGNGCCDSDPDIGARARCFSVDSKPSSSSSHAHLGKPDPLSDNRRA